MSPCFPSADDGRGRPCAFAWDFTLPRKPKAFVEIFLPHISSTFGVGANLCQSVLLKTGTLLFFTTKRLALHARHIFPQKSAIWLEGISCILSPHERE